MDVGFGHLGFRVCGFRLLGVAGFGRRDQGYRHGVAWQIPLFSVLKLQTSRPSAMKETRF